RHGRGHGRAPRQVQVRVPRVSRLPVTPGRHRHRSDTVRMTQHRRRVHTRGRADSPISVRRSWDARAMTNGPRVWLVAGCLAFLGIGAHGRAADATDDAAPRPVPAADPSPVVVRTTPSAESSPEPTREPVVLVFVTDQKDGDSWVGSDGREYRLGLVNTP